MRATTKAGKEQVLQETLTGKIGLLADIAQLQKLDTLKLKAVAGISGNQPEELRVHILAGRDFTTAQRIITRRLATLNSAAANADPDKRQKTELI